MKVPGNGMVFDNDGDDSLLEKFGSAGGKLGPTWSGCDLPEQSNHEFPVLSRTRDEAKAAFRELVESRNI